MTILRLALALTIVNIGLLLAALAQTATAGAQGTPAVLRGRALELVDGQGQQRARFNVESNGEVVLRLLDEQGTIRVKLGANEDGSGLLLANDATEPGVHILAKGAGSSIKLRDKDGRERIVTP
jgi:hypothetical protein